MGRLEKLLLQILSGSGDANLAFDDLRRVLIHYGFDERIRGSHHIFTRGDVVEILNLQAKQGKAKPYQVRQVREIILKYRLARFTDE